MPPTVHKGFVIDNVDPMHMQRLRIRVPAKHSGMPTRNIPWVMPAQPSVRLPRIGDTVEVQYFTDVQATTWKPLA